MRQADVDLRANEDQPIGLVLSGGGARGAFQVGVYEVLRRDPRGLERAPEVVSGTSAGALNGALIAAGLDPDQMLSFWLELADDPPVIANHSFFATLLQALKEVLLIEPTRPLSKRAREISILRRLFAKHRWYLPSECCALLLQYLMTARFDTISFILEHIRASYLFNTDELRIRLQRAIGAPELKQTTTRLAINTVDAKDGGVVRIVNYPPKKRDAAAARHYLYSPTISLDMIIASASIPVLFNPVRIGRRELWDGGLLVNTPLAPAVSLGARRIVPVLVTVREHKNGDSLATFGGAIERLADAFLENAYNIDRKLLLDRNALAALVPELSLDRVNLFREIRPRPGYLFDAGSYLYFEREAMTAMYEAGREAAKRWLATGVEVDGHEFDE
ncbi:MAG: patatin-like phospholipase family protein [Candidatus Schekmanbacteria bacterium]|nr:patatin-like phospholipase family protein [Candidatus Schekmanbacteria bacterium]